MAWSAYGLSLCTLPDIFKRKASLSDGYCVTVDCSEVTVTELFVTVNSLALISIVQGFNLMTSPTCGPAATA